MMAEFPGRERAGQRASGIWGQGRTYGQFQAQVNRLSPEQHAEYVRETIAGRGPAASLEGAKHMQRPGEGPQAFAGNLKPGSQDHIKAIWDLGTLAGHNVSDGRPSSDTLGTALHNVARSVAARDMNAARVHLESARWGNEHEAGMAYSSELDDIAAQLGRVPARELGWMPKRNPLMAEHQHPGSFRPTPGPPVAPTYGAMQIPHYEIDSGGHSQYANLLEAIELSARTAMLERTPAPRGKPGGPGLYDVKGMGHTAYLQQIVKALIEKRGMPPGKAYAIARGAIRRWSRGGGKVHPEVRAAAGKAEAGELEKQARARMSHGHANLPMPHTIELFNPAGNPSQARTPAGSAGGGQFTTGGSGQQSQQKGKAPAKPSAANAQARASLNTTIAQQQAQLKALRGILQQMMAGKITPQAASSAVSKLSKASTPKAKGAAATSAKGVAAAKAGAAATAAASATASKTATATAKKTVLTKAAEAKAITTKINALIKSIQANRAALAKLP